MGETSRVAPRRGRRVAGGHWLGWLVLGLALLEGGWLAYDGTHALVTGDYVTPRSGPHAGQLGPWAKLVSAAGIDPRSTGMKVFHAALGAAWIAVMVCFLFGMPGAWRAMLVCAVAGLWYLPFGTLLSVVQIVLLMLPPLRAGPGRGRAAA